MKPKQLQHSEYGPKTAEFLNIAYKDYLASRVLINAHLLVQGAVLASTTIEKYFKAILAFRGQENRGHLKKAHINAAKNYDARLARVLNDDFLFLLQRAYSLRYLDDLEVEFNLVLASREFLAELDFTACMFQESFTLKQGDVEVVQEYHQHKQQADPRLVFDNFLFMGVNKQDFISAEPQLVYEVRNCRLRGFIEATYTIAPTQRDGKFLRHGFEQVDQGGLNYQLAFKPLPPDAA